MSVLNQSHTSVVSILAIINIDQCLQTAGCEQRGKHNPNQHR